MRIIGLLVIMCLTSVAYTQMKILEGSIFGMDGITPIPYVLIEFGTGSELSNLEGKFKCELSGPGPWKLNFSSLGYYSDTITVNEDQVEFPLQIHLREKLFNLEGVVIEGKSLTKGHIESWKIPGSYHYITPDKLQKINNQDIHQIIKSIPGVYFQEEDGYGLRPNIGMRASGSERSAKITVMEDGILIAPAPYSAPAAYYFPHTGRLYGLEVLKGTNQIRNGPFTTSGSINLLSTPIPDKLSGQFEMGLGSFKERKIHSYIGTRQGHFGILAETYLQSTNGFKNIPEKANELGFSLVDFIVKADWQSTPREKFFQSFEIKIGQSKEKGFETYLGLSKKDFARDPYQRYPATLKDQINTEHQQYSITHFLRINPKWEISTTAYRNTFHRNWYKLDAISLQNETWSINKINSFENDEETGVINLLKADPTDEDHHLWVKANNRDYLSSGVQSIHSLNFKFQNIVWHVDAGIRYHFDQEDRFQWVDNYQWLQDDLILKDKGTPGSESNRINQANALAGFIQNNLEHNGWLITGGIRIESINHSRQDFGKEDINRVGIQLKERSNITRVLIPGIGLSKQFQTGKVIFAGIHKGFAPAGDLPGTLPETSWNTEVGYRFIEDKFQSKTTLFHNKYQRLLGSDLNAVGGTGSGNLYNSGSAIAYGVELEGSYLFKFFENWYVPASFQYTFNVAKFTEDFKSEFGPWSVVKKNDRLPYLPSSVLSGSIGLEKDQLSIRISSHFQSQLLTITGLTSSDEIIPARWLFDIHLDYRVNQNLSAMVHIQNATNRAYLAAIRPAGLRPGMPRSLKFGLKFNW